MEDEIDIYADLPNFNLGDDDNLVEKNKRITEKCGELEKQVTDLTQTLESVKKINRNLEVNLSSLLQTAKAEIARKDKMIAEIRRELENIKFRRGDFGKSSKPSRYSPTRKTRANSPKHGEYVQVQEEPDTTEFVCGSLPLPDSNVDNVHNKSNQLNGIVSTVFGERLRKKILEEQEAEQKERKKFNPKAEEDSKKTNKASVVNETSEMEAHTGTKKLESIGSKNKTLHQDDDVSRGKITTTDNHRDKKRHLEDQVDGNNPKKLKSNDDTSRHHNGNRHHDRESDKSSDNKYEKRLRRDIVTSDRHVQYRNPVESSTPVDDVQSKSGRTPLDSNADNDAKDKHNRVALRLMLLAEGYDPDTATESSAKKDEKKIIDGNRYDRKKTNTTSKSRSESSDRDRHGVKSTRRYHTSRSRTPDERRKSRRRSRQRSSRRDRSRDRFDRHRDAKNKDGDNLSEFSREIYDLREKIEHRGDENSEKGRSLSRHKLNSDKIHNGRRSRTSDSSRSASKERVRRGSRGDEEFNRSKSREKHRRPSREQRNPNADDIADEYFEPNLAEIGEAESTELVETKALLPLAETTDTKSLMSLEEGEIVDSASASPVKVSDSISRLIEKTVSPKCNLLDSEKLVPETTHIRSFLPLKEIGNNRNIAKPPPAEKITLPISISNPSVCVTDPLNSSKDERIENIAEFIANFTTDQNSDVLKSKTDENSSNVIHSNVDEPIETDAVPFKEKASKEKIRYILDTVFPGSSKDIPLELPSTETVEEVNTNVVNGTKCSDDWCLIAIDSPIKNFEENRKIRTMAKNALMIENLEPPNSSLSDAPETLAIEESVPTKLDSEDVTVISHKSPTPPVSPTKPILPKSNLTTLTSLRSTYHKGKKEMVLSDRNSQQCTKITSPLATNSACKDLRESDRVPERSKGDIEQTVQSENVTEAIFKNSNLEDVNSNPINSEKGEENCTAEDHCTDQDSLKNINGHIPDTIESKLGIIDPEPIGATTTTQSVDDSNKKHKKSKVNKSKTRKETTAKIDGDLRSELGDNGTVKESKSKQISVNKTDHSDTSKIPPAKSIVPKTTGSSKMEKTDKVNVDKGLDNSNKPVKVVSKTKVEGTTSKVKKEPPKLIVYARRKRPVHLEDSTTSLSVATKSNLLSDTANNLGKTSNSIEAPIFLNENGKTSNTQMNIPKQVVTETNDSTNKPQSKFDDVTSVERSNGKEKLKS